MSSSGLREIFGALLEFRDMSGLDIAKKWHYCNLLSAGINFHFLAIIGHVIKKSTLHRLCQRKITRSENPIK